MSADSASASPPSCALISAVIAASRSIMLLRRTSVGCAVSTGTISESAKSARIISLVTPDASSAATAPANCVSAFTSGEAFRSSAKFASNENSRKPRTKRIVSSRSRLCSLSASSAEAFSLGVRCDATEAARAPSIRSNTASPSCSRITSPSKRPR